MKRLHSKPCPYCGSPIFGRKRNDRNSYNYSPRCTNCARKSIDESVIKTRRDVLSKIRQVLPIGTKRLHKSREGLTYWRIKIAEPNVWEYEHRIIANAPKGFHVHHINHDTLDNRIENLAIIDPGEHSKHHGSITTWSRNHSCCVACGTREKRHLAKGLCTTCYQR